MLLYRSAWPTPLTDLHPPGAGAGAGASAGVLAEAVRRHQAEIAVPKKVHAAPHRVLRNQGIAVIRLNNLIFAIQMHTA